MKALVAQKKAEKKREEKLEAELFDWSRSVLHSASQSSGLTLSVSSSQVWRGHSSVQPASVRVRGLAGLVVGVVFWYKSFTLKHYQSGRESGSPLSAVYSNLPVTVVLPLIQLE